VKRVSKTVLQPAKRLVKLRSDRKIIRSFADKHGLVYFGFVSQRDDEHRIVRGLTLSTKHRDEHYCIGTFEDYDVVFVQRKDSLRSKQLGSKKAHCWHIFEFDLRTRRSLPHIFVGSLTHSEEFYMQFFTKFPTMRAVHLGRTTDQSPHFDAHFRVYTSPAALLEIGQLLTPEIISTVTKHFGNLAFEIIDDSLFIYSENTSLTNSLLEAMIKNGRWLAESIDRAAILVDSDIED
jgi:hypothetical protein